MRQIKIRSPHLQALFPTRITVRCSLTEQPRCVQCQKVQSSRLNCCTASVSGGHTDIAKMYCAELDTHSNSFKTGLPACVGQCVYDLYWIWIARWCTVITLGAYCVCLELTHSFVAIVQHHSSHSLRSQLAGPRLVLKIQHMCIPCCITLAGTTGHRIHTVITMFSAGLHTLSLLLCSPRLSTVAFVQSHLFCVALPHSALLLLSVTSSPSIRLPNKNTA